MTQTVTESATAVGDLILDTVSTAQDAFLSLVEALTATVKPISDQVTETLPSLPLADVVPAPAETVDAAFAFAEKVLANQKSFAGKLIKSYGL